MTALTQGDFVGYINNSEIVECLRLFRLPEHPGKGAYFANIKTLCDFLNNTDYITNEGFSAPRISREKVFAFRQRRTRERNERKQRRRIRERRKDDQFFRDFNKDQYKDANNSFDTYIRKITHDRLNKQRAIEDRIRRAR